MVSSHGNQVRHLRLQIVLHLQVIYASKHVDEADAVHIECINHQKNNADSLRGIRAEERLALFFPDNSGDQRPENRKREGN